MKILPVVLAGGSGTRLWPLSRESHPKQLLPLLGEHSLLQESIVRIKALPNMLPPLIICNKNYHFLISEQLKELALEDFSLILEPGGRNTAPAVAIAAHFAKAHYDENVLLLVMPADHLLQGEDKLRETILHAATLANKGFLMAFGIQPAFAETAYGYIHVGQAYDDKSYHIDRFIEKPNAKNAKAYVASGEYYWNSGLFLFRAEDYLAELTRYRPQIAECCKRAFLEMEQHLGAYLLTSRFMNCPDESIDYAIMENTQHALVLPLSLTWSDVGSWSSLWDVVHTDEKGNVTQGDVIALNTKNCYLRAEDRLVATIGLENHVVVETKDAILVATRDGAKDIKTLVAQLKTAKRREAEHHSAHSTAWGCRELVVNEVDYHVELLQINPGQTFIYESNIAISAALLIVQGELQLYDGNHSQRLVRMQLTTLAENKIYQLVNQEKAAVHCLKIETKKE